MEHKDKILITTDLNEKSLETNLNYTRFLTKKFGSKVSLIHVVEEAGFFSKLFGESSKDVVELLEKKFRKLAKNIEKEYGFELEEVIKYGRVTKEIADYANEKKFDLIITGTSNSGDREKNIGANTHRLIRIAECPVLTLHNDITPKDIKNILLPIELFVSSRQKVKNAVEWAESFGSKITVLASALEDNDGEARNKIKLIANNTKRFILKQGLECDLVMLGGIKDGNEFARGVIDYANDELNKVDMIMVMGKDESADFFMNSTAQFIISASKQPVLCVPLRKSGMSLTAIF